VSAEPQTLATVAESSRVSVGGRLLEIDGFRAIAAWMVMLHHAVYAFPNAPGATDPIPAPLRQILYRGWLGVDLFFVLSGFLITGILLDSKEKPRYFRNFYVRRILRIMPLYYFTLLMIWPFYPQRTGYFVLCLLFLANFEWFFKTSYADPAGVYWSLAVEEHFYLLWPLLVRFLNRRRMTILLLTIIVATPILRGVCAAAGMEPDRAIYQYSWFRFDGLALGALLAIWFRSEWQTRRRSLWLAAGLAALCIVITIAGTPFGLMKTKTTVALALRFTQVQEIFAAGVVTALVFQGSRWTAPLRWRFTLFSSDISYCMYLVHLSVGYSYMKLLGVWDADPAAHLGGFGALALRVFVIASVTLVIGTISKRFLEDPFLRLKRHFV
jgi:peptidoglycan/LPS O-acetylase OafA/YrhL